MASVDAKIKLTFREFKDIFENWHINYPPSKKSSDGRILYIPDEKVDVYSKSLNGLKLKDGVGVITVQQTLDKEGKPIAYTYRFISSEYEYIVCKNNVVGCDNLGNFYFHFDRCENDKPHKPHVSVMSPAFRYISSCIELKEFLEFIRDNFYSPQSIKKDNLLVNRP